MNKFSRLLKSKISIYRDKKGFTLVELLIVIAIIAILVGIVVVAINPGRLIAEANDSKKRQEMQQLKNSLQLYFNDFNRYPVEATEFIPSGCANCLAPVYIREIPEEFTGTATAIYDTATPVPAGEYRVGMELSTHVTEGNDDGSYDHCGGESSPPPPNEIPTGGVWNTTDYFICPD